MKIMNFGKYLILSFFILIPVFGEEYTVEKILELVKDCSDDKVCFS
jgi:hypothetical protein